MTTLLIMTDGRRWCIDKTIDSLRTHLHGSIDKVLIHDDSGDSAYWDWLGDRYPYEIYTTAGRSGFAGAIQSAWNVVDDDYILHWEDDFVLKKDVYIDDLIKVLSKPFVVQVALKRQPWNDQEKAAGGMIEMHPDSYTEKTDGEVTWTEHRRYFTTNPSLYHGSLALNDWPDAPESEGKFGIKIFKTNPNAVSTYFGGKFDPPLVDHIGDIRVGNGY